MEDAWILSKPLVAASVQAQPRQRGKERPVANPLASDELREMFQPLPPPAKPKRFRYAGRRRIDVRKAVTSILFVLKSGISWEMLPREMEYGSGMTAGAV